MNCDEFELAGLGGDAQDVALQHASTCARCAALLERWQAALVGLRSLASETREVQAPARVEMRLRQEFRAARRPRVPKRAAVAAAWALAAAAAIAAVVSWAEWNSPGNPEVVKQPAPVVERASAPAPAQKVAPVGSAAEIPGRAVRAQRSAANPAAEPFSLLPGIFPQEAEQTDLVKVRMRRAGLAAFGLPVNEERASDWIQVDMLVGYDGQPRAVRLDRTAVQGATEW